MTEFPDTELSRRLRANWGRRMLPDFATRMEHSLRYSPTTADFLDLPTTDRLNRSFLERLKEGKPTMTWPESQRASVFDHLLLIAERLGGDHSSYLAYFGGWKYLGALRVNSAAALRSGDVFWEEGREAFCLLTAELDDALFLDYTDPKQMFGADEYELYCWGDFDLRD